MAFGCFWSQAREAVCSIGAGHGEATGTAGTWLVSCWNQETKPHFTAAFFQYLLLTKLNIVPAGPGEDI